MGKPIVKFQQQSLIVPANSSQGRFYFPDLPNLRRVNTVKIEIYPESSVPVDINGVPAAPLTDLKIGYLTLVTNGEETVQNIPLARLNPITDYGSPYVFEVPELALGKSINFSKSYVTLSQNPSVATQFAFNFGIYYQ